MGKKARGLAEGTVANRPQGHTADPVGQKVLGVFRVCVGVLGPGATPLGLLLILPYHWLKCPAFHRARRA